MAEPGDRAIAALTVGCKFASPEMKNTGAGGGGGVGGGGVGGGGGAGGRVPPNIGGFPGPRRGERCGGVPTLTDFPPIRSSIPSAPANAPALFDGSTPRAGGAPCITSPIAGTLMPRNWLRPRFDAGARGRREPVRDRPGGAGFAHQLRVFTRIRHRAARRSLEPPAHVRQRQTITVRARALQTDAAGAVQLAPSARAESTS
jgi:hypothetical protein